MLNQIEVRLYVGKFGAPVKGTHERMIREWAAGTHFGMGPLQVFGLNDVVGKVRAAATQTQYRDNPVLVTMKVLEAAGQLTQALPNDGGD